jgi:hypothetical protein
MLERTDAITNEVLEPITFVLAYPTVLCFKPYLRPKEINKSANSSKTCVLMFLCCIQQFHLSNSGFAYGASHCLWFSVGIHFCQSYCTVLCSHDFCVHIKNLQPTDQDLSVSCGQGCNGIWHHFPSFQINIMLRNFVTFVHIPCQTGF